MKRILYIGGFEMPDRNAAAQRVLSVSKALRALGYQVSFYGISKTKEYKGTVDGFSYVACPYPTSWMEWIKYACGSAVHDFLIVFKPDLVITYNYPSVAQERIIHYCRAMGIKVVGDITEWYDPKSILKKLDCTIRMRFSNKHLDGIIAISKFLFEYYKSSNHIYLPPLVDKNEDKWKDKTISHSKSKAVRFIYVGSPGAGKDRLDLIVDGLAPLDINIYSLDIIGITTEDYFSIYNRPSIDERLPIRFHGRIPHRQAVSMLMESDFQVFFRDIKRVNNAGFPTKFAEAVSAGVPVITNKISNVSDYIVDGYNSYLIEEPTAYSIWNVLQRVVKLSREEIELMKSRLNSDLFDYRNYVGQLGDFLSLL